MGNVNRNMRGLVSLLQLISDGRQPDQLLGTLQATLDVRDFYLGGATEQLVSAALAIAPNTVGIYTDMVVPPGEFWYVLNATAEATITQANDSFSIQLQAHVQGNFLSIGPSGSGSSNAVNTQARALHRMDKAFFLAQGGTSFASYMSSKALAGNVSSILTIQFVRLRG